MTSEDELAQYMTEYDKDWYLGTETDHDWQLSIFPWLQQTFVGEDDCVTNPKSVCLGGYTARVRFINYEYDCRLDDTKSYYQLIIKITIPRKE